MFNQSLCQDPISHAPSLANTAPHPAVFESTAKKQLLAVTPEGSPGAGAGAAQKRKTAEERQWEAWATPPDGRQ
jgi:hypothetical protein